MKIYKDIFEKIISLESLFSAWEEFKKGKQKKKDVMEFEFNLEENMFNLRRKLKNKTYAHGGYHGFYITDPKVRHIHKAAVKDRILHHAIYSVLNPIFESTFIYDSYSCRKSKGTHKGINRLEKFLRKASKNNFKPSFAMKCDIRKFFESVDHDVLISIIEKRIKDDDAMWLIKGVIESFQPGIPIGNLTSQMFANIYLNELDQFAKQVLKVLFYLRYTDDFVIISESKEKLENWLPEIKNFLFEKLKMELHPNKIIFRKYRQGIDFLGYVQFPHHRVLRIRTRKRIIKKVKRGVVEQSLQSYLGVLSHADSHKLSEEIKNLFWFNKIKNPEDLRDKMSDLKIYN